MTLLLRYAGKRRSSTTAIAGPDAKETLGCVLLHSESFEPHKDRSAAQHNTSQHNTTHHYTSHHNTTQRNSTQHNTTSKLASWTRPHIRPAHIQLHRSLACPTHWFCSLANSLTQLPLAHTHILTHTHTHTIARAGSSGTRRSKRIGRALMGTTPTRQISTRRSARCASQCTPHSLSPFHLLFFVFLRKRTVSQTVESRTHAHTHSDPQPSSTHSPTRAPCLCHRRHRTCAGLRSF